jgi:hypothetical protein
MLTVQREMWVGLQKSSPTVQTKERDTDKRREKNDVRKGKEWEKII